MENKKNYIELLNNYKVTVFSLVGIILGIGLIFLGIHFENSTNVFMRTYAFPLMRDFGSLVSTTGAISLTYELLMKRSFTAELLAKANLSKDIDSIGLHEITFNPKDEVGGITWSSYIQKSNTIKVLFVHGIGWRLNNQEHIENVMMRKDAIIEFYLPDFREDYILQDISKRYSKSIPTLKRDIINTVKILLTLSETSLASFIVRLTEFSPQYSMYLFEDVGIIAYSSCSSQKRKVPHFVCKKSSNEYNLYSFIQAELNSAYEKSKTVDFEDIFGVDHS